MLKIKDAESKNQIWKVLGQIYYSDTYESAATC